MLAKSLENKFKDNSFKGLIFFGHIPEMSFPQWLYNFYVRLNTLVLFPKPISESAPDSQAVGVTVTPNFPLPARIKNSDKENVLVSKTDANLLQKVHAETLGKIFIVYIFGKIYSHFLLLQSHNTFSIILHMILVSMANCLLLIINGIPTLKKSLILH